MWLGCTRDTWNKTEASRCIYTLTCLLTGPAANHCVGNGLGHLWIVKCPNVHIISLQLFTSTCSSLHMKLWLIATEPYDRIPIMIRAVDLVMYLHRHLYEEGSSSGLVANMQDCGIVVSSNSSCTVTFTFRLMPLGKCMNLLILPAKS